MPINMLHIIAKERVTNGDYKPSSYYSTATKAEETRQKGIAVDAYLLYRSPLSSHKNQKETEKVLKESDFSKKQRVFLWQQQFPKSKNNPFHKKLLPYIISYCRSTLKRNKIEGNLVCLSPRPIFPLLKTASNVEKTSMLSFFISTNSR